MGAIPEADPDEPVETKPFKFVTGLLSIGSLAIPRYRGFGIVWFPYETLTTSDATGYDARFPQQNQSVNRNPIHPNHPETIANSTIHLRTKHCWQNYVDYHKCVNAKGEDFRPCRQFFHAFRSLCPKAWTDRWDTQREAGNFPARLG
ncbi:cytochrome c oxidase, subunit VIb [Aspergillus alliaceus]|uniref:Cytochrome c oxidase, subunit VIb n=1 Tax=Petromyces alliaceus TaxID=209559 RepID=A0A5N7CHK7_PETAA|nr:cytochrome c oxidase, subunit VIb [Aspergillus alliaceus]